MPDEAAPSRRKRLAIVLFNLGGPDSPQAVWPFLRNLFSDPAILRVPFFVRPWLARRIARARLKPASENYALLGGRSPLLELTQAQATALERALTDFDARCFIAMRYWNPRSATVALEVKAWRPDEVVLLPLYPQFSTTTTASSLADWRESAARAGLVAPVATLCCWPDQSAYVRAIASLLAEGWQRAKAALGPEIHLRVLFSAHGLPEAIVRAGDPYQWQIERTTKAVLAAWGEPGIDWTICYQSRATPQKWLSPSTDEEIERAGREGIAVVVVPIAFVSEHSETMVELDVEYRRLAERSGVVGYFRVPTPNDNPAFIRALAEIVRRAVATGPGLCSHAGGRICPAQLAGCPVPGRP